jgi:hypothetical protein
MYNSDVARRGRTAIKCISTLAGERKFADLWKK